MGNCSDWMVPYVVLKEEGKTYDAYEIRKVTKKEES